MSEIVLGISSCLLGNEVRYDGSHKRNAYITKTLGRYFTFVPFCPEMSIGLGTPRPTLRLVGKESVVKLVEVKNPDNDFTALMEDYAEKATQSLDHLCGFILKKGSPSCGMERVKIYHRNGMPDTNGSGLFARTLLARYPNLPVEEEGRLNDSILKENFIERVFVYYRWQQLKQEGLSVNRLMEFHSRHKFNLLAHDESVYRSLGPLVAACTPETLEETAASYISGLMQSLRKPATRKRHTNVLMHVAGFLKKSLQSGDKAELGEILDKYRRGQLPLIVPLTLLRHHLRKAPNQYIEKQYYMSPYPEELMLRNSL